jgi:asparagine synthase (glutamine-hydrolysing)
MCGIVGRVCYGADLGGRADLLTAAVDTMALRGPDDEGTWARGPVILGHRRLAVIDIGGGRQPMLGGTGSDPLAALTYSGEVYNFPELRKELIARGRVFRTRSDTEVVLQAYLEWGRDFVRRLNGMYAFAVWDERRQELLLVRDRLGIKPLYYAPRPDGVLFGSEPKAILAMPDFPAVVDAQGLREVMSLVATPGLSPWRGIHEVPPAAMVVADRRGCRLQGYWSLEAHEHPDDLPGTVARTRELVAQIVSEQMTSDVPLCTLLSGGLDSSVITALAAGHRRSRQADPVRSFAVTFEGYEETFTPDNVRPTPDDPFARELAAHVGSDHAEVRLSSEQLIDRAVRDRVVRAYDQPPVGDEMSMSQYLLFATISERSTVALSGEGSDEIFGGYSWFHDPVPEGASTFPWLAHLSGFSRFSVLRPEVDRQLRLDEFAEQQYRDAVAGMPLMPGEDHAERRMREVTYLTMTRFLPGLLKRKDRMSMATGLEVRVPYCDYRLGQYLFNVPWRYKAFDGHEKSLLRAAAADLLPQSVLTREKSNFPATQDVRYDALVKAEFTALLESRDSALFDIADPKKMRWLARDIGGRSSTLFSRRAREQVLALGRWLDMYRPHLML